MCTKQEIKEFHEDVDYIVKELGKILASSKILREKSEYGFQINAMNNLLNKNEKILKHHNTMINLVMEKL